MVTIKQLMLTILFASLLTRSYAQYGFSSDIDTWVGVDFDCLKDEGIDYVQMLVCYPNGTLIDQVPEAILDASYSEITTDLIVELNNNVNPLQFVQTLKKEISSDKIQNIFFSPNSLSKPFDVNCLYTQYIVGNLTQAYPNNSVGLISDNIDWKTIFGGVTSCAQFTNRRLTYLSYDGNPDFEDWSLVQFGDWSSPFAKYWSEDMLCGDDGLEIYEEEEEELEKKLNNI